MPGAPEPNAFTGLMQARDGTRFAFAEFAGRGERIEVILRGGRSSSYRASDLEKLRSDTVEVEARIGGKKVGSADFKRFSVIEDKRLISPGEWSSDMTEVNESWRRRRVALSLYGMMKACGFRVRPSTAILSAGIELWGVLDPAICEFPLKATEPTCDDPALIAVHAQEFEAWRDGMDRVRDCRSIADITALGAVSAPYLTTIQGGSIWPSRKVEAERFFRQFARYDDVPSVLSELQVQGMPAWAIWSYRLMGRKAPGPVPGIIQACREVVRRARAADAPQLSAFRDYQKARSEWCRRIDRPA
ncbi:hypothetical protein [Caulobacter sp. Root1455]|uniref:hypothetical protein n=1 Tax=Caulobacter sp. Root1455 TaxID=1736465 RepID=UPI0012E360C9|nr:hypothetical protein [Caulobacter sp. Root1455]